VRVLRRSGVQKLPATLLILMSAMAVSLAVLTGCENGQGVKIGGAPPEISGTDIHGGYVSLRKFKGKVVVIYFWTDSCCGGSLKQLVPLYDRHRYDGLEIIAINELGTKQDVARYAKDNTLTFTMLTDERSMLLKQYQVFGFPTIFILDRNGIVREKIMGDIQTAKLEKLTSAYLGN
jgi:peroxiredoxin